MSEFKIFSDEFWSPLAKYGLTSKFWLLNSETLINSWATLIVMLIVLIFARMSLTKRNSIPCFLVLSIVRALKDLVSQSLKRFNSGHFYFVSAVFIYILFNNIISIIPWFEEPTTDVNTTLAFGIISFGYVQAASIRANGLAGYFKEFFEPFFLMFPLNIVGELAKIISISFRLFGNIFGGSVISKLFASAVQGSIAGESLAILSGVNFLITGFFVLFEGTIQAFVFAMLTLTYIALATQGEIEEKAAA
jgi:F-type H+-transporting ATPase subunit a